MKNPDEMKELEKISSELSTKKSCKPCRIILIAALVLFVVSLLLAMLSLSNTRKSTPPQVEQRVLTPEQSFAHAKDLHYQILLRQGSSTIIIGKSKTK